MQSLLLARADHKYYFCTFIDDTPHFMKKILVIGAAGQLGSELTLSLRTHFGIANVIATDLRPVTGELAEGPSEILDVMKIDQLDALVKKHRINEIYHLAAILSAKGEQNPKFAWDLNMTSLLNVLEVAKAEQVKKVYWPSSIAVFGPETPKQNTPQNTYMDPNTMYGISKLAGERWCDYYFQRYQVDVRSLRYPGLISYKTQPGGGTTDYAVDIYWKAILERKFECFLRADTALPMMYMDDAVRGTIELMEAPADQIHIRSSYNLSAMSFTPDAIYKEIRKHYPDFTVSYKPDFRQVIADSWPASIDDQAARKDWGWKPKFDLAKMTQVMLKNLEAALLPSH